MEEDIYEDIADINLGDELLKLQEQNKQLVDQIRKLQGDIKGLSTDLTNMKKTQENLSRNISALFNTAKLEIQRKDRIISELRQEVDNMVLQRGYTYNRSKRPSSEEVNNKSAKRVKNDTFEDRSAVQGSRRDGSPTRTSKYKMDSSPSRSTPDSIKVDGHKSENRGISKSNNDFRKNTRCPSPTNFRRNVALNEGRSHNRRYMRNRSNDRQNYRDNKIINEHNRSRSNERYGGDRFRRNRSNNRWSDSRDREQSNRNEAGNSRYNQPRSKSIGRMKTPPKDEDRLENEKENKYLEKRKNKVKCLEILDLTLEEGEITAESDDFPIEEMKQKNNYISGDKTKSITIEEYRNKRKSVEPMEDLNKKISPQETVKENNEKQKNTNEIVSENLKSSDNNYLLQKNAKEATKQQSINHEDIVDAEIFRKHTEESDNAKKSIAEKITAQNNETIDDFPGKNNLGNSEKGDDANYKSSNDISLNDTANSTSKLFSSDDSKILSDSSLGSNSQNLSINTSIRRRRRCVVIGIRDK